MEEIQKELRVRQRVLSIYNKISKDFNSKSEWDDYLEMIEDIIYSLVNRINDKETEAKVIEYERTNRLNIIANQARLAEEQKQAQLLTEQATAVPDSSAEGGARGPTAAFQQPQTLLAAQPMPLAPPQLDSEGRLPPPSASASRFAAMAAASGWSPELPASRALQEVFSSLLVF